MIKEWIALFSLCDRALLQNELNSFIRDHDVIEIKVWNDEGNWNASVRYTIAFPANPAVMNDL